MKLLHLDVETSPNTAFLWGLFKQTVSISQIVESSYLLCWSAKWHKQKEIMFSSKHVATEIAMLDELWRLLDEADVVVHYNGRKFDIPTINKEFLLNGYAPPSPYKQIDLLSITRQQFRFPSNKLDYVAQQLGLGKKHPHIGFELWVKCMENDPKAWKMMEKYNKQDVVLLEKLYIELLPWITSHPNMGLYVDADRPVCTNCGGTNLYKRGFSKTLSQMYSFYNY